MPRRERNEDRPQVEKKNMSAFVVFVSKQVNQQISEARGGKVWEKKQNAIRNICDGNLWPRHTSATSINLQAVKLLVCSWKTLGWNTMQPTVWGCHSSTAIFCKDFVTAATLSEDAESSLLGNILSTLGQDYDYSRNSAQAQIHANRANSVWARLHAWNLVHPKAAPSKGNRHRTLTPMFKG